MVDNLSLGEPVLFRVSRLGNRFYAFIRRTPTHHHRDQPFEAAAGSLLCSVVVWHTMHFSVFKHPNLQKSDGRY